MLKPPPARTLRAVVFEILDGTDLCDPRDVADEVLKRLSRPEREAVMRAALVTEVRLAIGEHRRPAPERERAEPVKPRPSAKVRAIRDAWAATLAGRYSVAGQWKRLAECTVEDVLTLAAERRQKAADNAAHAERFEALAKALADAGVATVGELDAAPAGWLQ